MPASNGGLHMTAGTLTDVRPNKTHVKFPMIDELPQALP
jgi:hypothetical protein